MSTKDSPSDVRVACRMCGRYVLLQGTTASTAAGLQVVCAECLDDEHKT